LLSGGTALPRSKTDAYAAGYWFFAARAAVTEL